MSRFHCSAGHRIELAFGDEQIRSLCPECGVDVYKYRDAVLDDDIVEDSSPATTLPPARTGRYFGLRALIFTGVGVLLIGAVYCTQRWAPAPTAPAPHDLLIPLPAAFIAPPRDPSGVSISNFSALPAGDDSVTMSFRLTNADPVVTEYPGLAVHWHGAAHADQLIASDAYAHPPVPFTSTDVVLELERPPGATGIDVKLIY